ncbi:hypothetical protein PACTADRAFT_67841 [Pachysolen tannophilus NRRL Y-2460]|uniref:COX assembly mitochondrial protein n=1 Tax=Pachysolen tannophilus NRRL Y-2460 TaxID=669874 RepID=A0A1E4TX97_PACTA|nr:hypothetical protein PACTADRAFT_67841 [Pachysolen tannophilus NRRL Y-2460]
MHPHLDPERFSPCEKLIDALEECHRTQHISKLFGFCNEPKQALSDCLHEVRLEAARQKILETREKRKNFEDKMQKLKEEEYGKDLKLKKIFEKEYELNKK